MAKIAFFGIFFLKQQPSKLPLYSIGYIYIPDRNIKRLPSYTDLSVIYHRRYIIEKAILHSCFQNAYFAKKLKLELFATIFVIES